MSTLIIPQPGYQALAQRQTRPLAASQAFNPAAIVGLDAAGKATPFLTGTVVGIQFAIGILDPVRAPAAFTSGASDTSPVLTGHFTMLNGTSGNAIVQASVGEACYTADGLTANLTNAANPKVGGGTTTGKLLGTILGLDPNIVGNVLISVIPEINQAIAIGGAAGIPVPVADGGTGASTAAGARTNLAAAQAAVATGATAPTFMGSAPAANPTPVTGIHGTWTAPSGTTPGFFTITSGGPTAGIGGLVGGIVQDTAGNGGVITANSATTPATGTVSLGLSVGSPATSTTLIIVPPAIPTGAVASHTHTQS